MLGLWEVLRELEERGAQLLNRRERELHLRLDAGRCGDPEFAPGLGGVLEEGGLADARFAMHHQHAAMPAAHAVQQPVERLAFAFPAMQPPS
jgi:hypothetical protein